MRSGEEIQAALGAFVAKWQTFSGSEKAEAQTYLNELVDCFGLDRQASGMLFEHFVAGAGFMDMFWPGRALVEMKAPSRTPTLEDAQPQAERYWRASAAPDGAYGAVRYVVLCSFHRILVWDMHQDPSRPAAALTLDELPDHYEALGFLVGERTRGVVRRAPPRRSPSIAAAADVDALPRRSQTAVPPRRTCSHGFVMQCVWTLFAEDHADAAGLSAADHRRGACARRDRQRRAETLGYLFRVLNQKGDHNRTRRARRDHLRQRASCSPEPAEVDLTSDELDLLLRGDGVRLAQGRPDDLRLADGGSARASERRWELGAHFTPQVDIMKIVGTVDCASHGESGSTRAQRSIGPRLLLDEMLPYRCSTQPAAPGIFSTSPTARCERGGMEKVTDYQRLAELSKRRGCPSRACSGVRHGRGSSQWHGHQSVRTVELAKVTMMIGRKLSIERAAHQTEPALRLDKFSTRTSWRGDALISPQGNLPAWPAADCDHRQSAVPRGVARPGALGRRTSCDWIKREFNVGVKDLLRRIGSAARSRAHGARGSVPASSGPIPCAQNLVLDRRALDYVVANGGVITDAVSSQKWPGEAKVHVSLVNRGSRAPSLAPSTFTLDGVSVSRHIAGTAVYRAVDRCRQPS